MSAVFTATTGPALLTCPPSLAEFNYLELCVLGSHAVSRPRAAPPKQEEEEEEDLETEIARVAREMYKAFSGMNGFPCASDQVL